MTSSTRFGTRAHARSCAAAFIVCVLTIVGCDASEPVQADLSQELSGGNGPFVASTTGAALPEGYELHEFVAAGVATDYTAGEGGQS